MLEPAFVDDSAAAASRVDAPPLALINLLNDTRRLSELLVQRTEAGDMLNAFLLAAGMAQIAADYLHADPLRLHRAGSRLLRHSSSFRARAAAALAHRLARALAMCRRVLPGQRRARAWLLDLDSLVLQLAGELVGEAARTPEELTAASRELARRLDRLPAGLARELVRLPSCFRNFDMSLEDLERLAAAFAADDRGPQTPLVVVGVRTSGSYLAPLLAQLLRRHGCREVCVITVRPGRDWLGWERKTLRRVARRGGTAVLCDDPPRTGATLAAAARELERLGFEKGSIALLLQLFGSDTALPALREYRAVVIPWHEWSVQRRLTPAEVAAALDRLLCGGVKVTALRPLDDAQCAGGRAHAAASFQARFQLDGRTTAIGLLRVRGVGLGYFGDHAAAVAERLDSWVPDVLGLEDGLLYEALPHPSQRLAEPLTRPELEGVAAYVMARASALPVEKDPSLRLAYRGAIWHRAGQMLAGLFGALSDAGRPLAAVAAREMLRVERPSVIDGLMELDRFASAGLDAGLLKTDFDAGPFTAADDGCFDPAYDLARLAADLSDPDSADELRGAYEELSRAPVEPERWLLHSFVALAEDGARTRHSQLERERRLACLFRRYYAEVLLADAGRPTDGPLCALDIDGVLESAPLGFNATSPSGALALRALLKHGFRPLLATGRSLCELVECCRAYHLAGGIAEYGAVIYDAERDHVRGLLTAPQSEALVSLRATLRELPAVELDPDHVHSVRAFRWRRAPAGWSLARDRAPLPIEEAAAAISRAGVSGLVRVVPGRRQTDFVPAGVEKASGLAALLEGRGFASTDARPLDLAVGDTLEDLGMLNLARQAWAPANADAAVRAARVRLAGKSCQAGLLEIVGHVLGHAPERCRECAPPPLRPATRLLLELLAIDESSGLAKAARLAWLLRHGPVRRGIAL